MTLDWVAHIEDTPNRERTLRVLRRAVALGCTIEEPPAAEQTYLNIRPPAGSTGRARIAAMHTRTGHIEFQDGSGSRLAHLQAFRILGGGNKAALNLDSDLEVRAVLDAFDIEVAHVSPAPRSSADEVGGGPLEAALLAVRPGSTVGLDVCRFFQDHPGESFTHAQLKAELGCSDRILRQYVPEAVNADRVRIVIDDATSPATFTYRP